MRKLKYILLAFSSLIIINTSHAQWISDATGKKSAVKLANKAIDCMANLEYGRAQGFALAALEIDSRTTTAKIVMSWTSGNDLSEAMNKEIMNMDMTETERLWMTIIKNPGNTHAGMAKASGNKQPIITYIAAYESYESLDQWAKANPEIAGPAINSLAYADFMGQGPRMISPPDGINHERAEQRFKDYIKLTDSPNADDSYAEYLASQGDYAAALAYQSNAFQKLYFVSPYYRKLELYWRKANKEQMESALIERVEAFYNDLERLDSKVDDMIAKDVTITEGMSSMESWISSDFDTTIDRYAQTSANMNWIERKAYDIRVDFGPNNDMGIVTFYMKGKYSTATNAEVMDYHTRASEVWVLQGNNWYLMHSNFAPYEGGTGVPTVSN